MHPEVSTIDAVFGYNEVVPKSLDLIRTVTPPTDWMNGISSYSMWWILIQEEWWMHHGNRSYLEAQKDYLRALLRHLAEFVGADGRENLNGMRFLDWPTSGNPQAVHEGLQAMMTPAMQSGGRLMKTLNDDETAKNMRGRSQCGSTSTPRKPADGNLRPHCWRWPDCATPVDAAVVSR